MDDVHLKEWEITRSTLKAFDDRLHDLRKFGFSFLTALLTAEAILIPSVLAESFDKAVVPGFVRFCILLVTLLLIVAIKLIERNYQLFIKAIVQRALVLERELNIELSETITFRHRQKKVYEYGDRVFFAFVGAVLVLGIAIL